MSVGELLRKYGLHPKRSLGQHFLVDRSYLERIVAAAELTGEDQVLEVGPGLGTLTRALAERARRVVAVELDARFVAALQETLTDLDNVEIVEADILQVDVGALMGGRYKVVANLPYQITSAALRHLLESKPRPGLLVVMVQKEVAQRIVAAPGQMSLLAVGVQFYGRPRLVARVPAGAFHPRPQVDSAIVRVDVYEEPGLPEEEIPRFFSLVRAGFGQRRKQLRNALAQGLALPPDVVEEALRHAGIAPTRRAETLSLAEWKAVLEALGPRLHEGVTLA